VNTSEQSIKLRMARAKWRLCAAAEVVLAKKGGAATVADILELAGMSRRSYYEFFRSIDDMIESMAQHFAGSGFGPHAPWMVWVKEPGIGKPDVAAKMFQLARIASESEPTKPPSADVLLSWFARRPFTTEEAPADVTAAEVSQ
jgi:AcrR family transcriptional regulator